ncbi:MAG TPA: hypothetical protein VFR87_10630 [Nocardioidaceae bacterium]|nr:hypothetical protein [Nocardioidaceae bacterium]
MLGSWLFWLTATATVLLAPSLVALLRVDRHSHKAPPRGLERRVGLVAGTTVVAVAALLVAALLGADGPGSVLVAVALGASVLGAARRRNAWAVRGVVTYGLLVAGTVATLLWSGYRVLTPPGSVLSGLLLGGLWGLAAWGAVRLRQSVEGWLGARAALDEPVSGYVDEDTVDMAPVGAASVTPSGRRPLLRRTGVALAAFVLPAAGVAAVAGGRPAPDPAPPAPRAGAEDAGRPSHAGGTGSQSTSPWSSATGAATTPTRSTGGPTLTGAPGPRGGEASAVPTPSDTTVWDVPTERPSPTESGLPTVIPLPTGWPDESRTPGYAKEKPNRPSDAPSPGSGKG